MITKNYIITKKNPIYSIKQFKMYGFSLFGPIWSILLLDRFSDDPFEKLRYNTIK